MQVRLLLAAAGQRRAEVAGLNGGWPGRAAHPRVEAKVAAGTQVEGQVVRLVEQLLQRHVEQLLDGAVGKGLPEQVVGTAVRRDHVALLVEHHQPGPGAVEVVQAGIEAEQVVLLGEQLEDQAVLHRLAHHLDHAQGVRGRQVAVAGHVEHGDHASLLVEDR